MVVITKKCENCYAKETREPVFTFTVCAERNSDSSETIEPTHDKTNTQTVRPAKTPISLAIRPVRSESSLCAQSVAKDPSFLHADSKDSDQTGRMPRLI